MRQVAKQLGREIRRRRKAKRLTLERLAEKVNYSIEHLSGIEHGHRTPSFGGLLNIAKALDTSLADLFRFHGRPLPRSREQAARKVAKILNDWDEDRLAILLELLSTLRPR